MFVALYRKSTRPAFLRVLRCFFARQIISVLFALFVYVVLIVFLLYKVQLWNGRLLKDTVFWTFGEAVIVFFSLNKAKNLDFFKDLFVDTFRWFVVIEFLINFYTFDLVIELILLPGFVLLILAFSLAKKDHQLKIIEKLSRSILAVLGISVFGFVVYKIATHYQEILNINNLLSLIHPLVMTVAFLPFAYTLALYMGYESLFVRIDLMRLDPDTRRQAKRKVLLAAQLNLNKLYRISSNFNLYDFIVSPLTTMIKKLATISKGQITTIVDGEDVGRAYLWSSVSNDRQSLCFMLNGDLIDIIGEVEQYYLVKATDGGTRAGYCLKDFVVRTP